MIKNLSVRTVPQNTHTGTPAERSGGILWLLTGTQLSGSRTHLLGVPDHIRSPRIFTAPSQ
jgi:hypothetical protein